MAKPATVNSSIISYKNRRLPPQIIAGAVWLHFRFPLSLRLVMEMIRRCGRKFGAANERQLRRKSPSRKGIWHLASGRRVDLHRRQEALALVSPRRDACIIGEIVQARRDTKAAKRLLARLLEKQGRMPKRIITDQPCS